MSGFHIKKPDVPSNAPPPEVKAFAAAAADVPLTVATHEENVVVVQDGAATKEEIAEQFPWEGMDDKVLKTNGYTVQFPASVYAQMKFLSENEPGGPSIRTQVMEALEPYLAAKIAKYEKRPG